MDCLVLFDQCNFDKDSDVELIEHMRVGLHILEVPPSHSCNECEFVFNDEQSLLNHVRNTHQKEKTDLGDKSKTLPEDLSLSETTDNDGNTEVLVNTNDGDDSLDTRNTEAAEDIHVRLSDSNLMCLFCGANFDDKYLMESHEAEHVDKADSMTNTKNMKIRCDFCEVDMIQQQSMNMH